MKSLIVVASLSVFCILQAVYWIIVSRKRGRDSVLADRLGTDDSLHSSALLKRDEDEGAFSSGITDLLESAGADPNVGAFLTRCMVFFLGSFALAVVLTGDVGAGLFFALVGAGLPYLGLLRGKSKRMMRIEEQLPEALEVMTISLRAGQSLDQTIKNTAFELEAPIGEEFQRIAQEVQLGRSLEQSLLAMSERLPKARTVRTFVVSVLVLRQTGGNLIEVLDNIIDTMRQQHQYESKLRAMTAEGRSSARMLAGLPPAFLSMAYLANGNYISQLFADPLGRVLLGISATLYVIGLTWTRRLVNPRT